MKCNMCLKEFNRSEMRLYATKWTCKNCFNKDMLRVKKQFDRKVMPSLVKAINKVLN